MPGGSLEIAYKEVSGKSRLVAANAREVNCLIDPVLFREYRVIKDN